ncbi:MAG: glycosyltransferase family 2 protein [Vibrio diabolicus]
MQETKPLIESDISVGILSYQRTDLLLKTIFDLTSINAYVDLIIVNNNEGFCIEDEIRQVIKHCKNINLIYIYDKINYGVAIGRRKIIDACVTDYIIMLDDDVSIPDINKVVATTLDEFNSDSQVKGIAFNIKEYNTKNHNRYEIPHKNKKINMDSRFFTYLMIGAGHALHVPSVKRVGNYPDDFGMYGFEEVDVSFRLINAGYKIVFNPHCLVEHKKSPDGRFSNQMVNKLAFVNRTKMAKRYFSLPNFLVCYVVRSAFFLGKTKNFSVFLSASQEIFSDKKKQRFSSVFYNYVKSVRGFIWW